MPQPSPPRLPGTGKGWGTNNEKETPMNTPDVAAMTAIDVDNAVDGLFAYDSGAVDSGVTDRELRERLRRHLRSVGSGHDFEVAALGVACRLFLTAGARELGHTEEDAVLVIEWMRDLRYGR